MPKTIESFLSDHGRRALLGDECSLGKNQSMLCRQGPPLGRSDEEWPHCERRPHVPVLSIHTKELPFVPEFLSSATYWTFFIAVETWEQVLSDGSLVVRRYESTAGLQQLEAPAPINPNSIGLHFREIFDYPCHEALERILSDQPGLLQEYENCADEMYERFPCHPGIKVGGYPHLIQPTAFLMELNPDYQIQIDISEYFHKGDSGIGYICHNLSYGCWETL